MYVWARLARVAATAKRRGRLGVGEDSRLAFRCLPSDIDSNLHMNNARYMMLADLGRIDIFLRTGLLALARRRGWTPMLSGLQVAFTREVRLWQRVELVSRIDSWDGAQAIGSHRFVLEDGTVAALIVTVAGLYDRAGRRFVPVEEMLAELGRDAPPPRPLTEEERRFLAAHAALRQRAKAGG